MSTEKEKNPALEAVMNELGTIKTNLATMENLLSPKPLTSLKHEHTSDKAVVDRKGLIEHLEECPDCKKAVYDKVYKKKDPVVCDGCGSIVGKDESECEYCKGTKANPI